MSTEHSTKRDWSGRQVWDVEITDECRDWYESLPHPEKDRLGDAVQALAYTGPTLRRPLVGLVLGSKIPALSEIRVGSMRVLFTFSPRQVAILLWGADKSEHGWKSWYDREGKPMAERLWDEYLAELEAEGLL